MAASCRKLRGIVPRRAVALQLRAGWNGPTVPTRRGQLFASVKPHSPVGSIGKVPIGTRGTRSADWWWPHSPREELGGHSPINGWPLLTVTEVTKLWLHQLRRRSQKGRAAWPWERMNRLVERYLPQPKILHPYPKDRFRARLTAGAV